MIGEALGLPLGVFLAVLVTRTLTNEGVGFHRPIGSLLIFTAIRVLAGAGECGPIPGRNAQAANPGGLDASRKRAAARWAS